MNRDNTPNFNLNNKNIQNFRSFISNIDSEKEELLKIKRKTKPNSRNGQQFIGNPKTKYNKVTNKLDTNLDPNIINDKIDSLEESKIYETNADYDIYNKIIKSHSYRELVEKLRNVISDFQESISDIYDEGDTNHIAALEIAIQDALEESK